MKYDKQPIDFARQIELLKERGMQFPDEEVALEMLYSISYFRIADIGSRIIWHIVKIV